MANVSSSNTTTLYSTTQTTPIVPGAAVTTGPVNTTNFTTLYSQTNGVPGGGASDDLLVKGNLRVLGTSDLEGRVTIANSYSLPTSDGAVDQVMTTDGNGNVSFTDATGVGKTYDITASSTTGGANFNLNSDVPTTDTIKFTEGSGISVVATSANEITIASTSPGTTYDFNASSSTGGANLNLVGSDSTTDTVKLTDGGHITATYTSATVVTLGSDATNANTANAIISRDASGNFSAGQGTFASGIKIDGATSGSSAFTAPATGSTLSYVLPGASGAASTVLTNDGSGGLSWTTPPGTTYTIDASSTTGGANFNLQGGGTDTIKFSEGSNVTITATSANEITISSTGGGTGSVSATPNTLVLRDANANSFANNTFNRTRSYVLLSSPATVNLTAADEANWYITSTGTSVNGTVFRLPDATTLPVGATYTFVTSSTVSSFDSYNVANAGGTLLSPNLNTGATMTFILVVNTTSNGTWKTQTIIPNNTAATKAVTWNEDFLYATDTDAVFDTLTAYTRLSSERLTLYTGGFSTTLQPGTTVSNTTYTLPTAYPAANGYVLSSTTGGTMTWASPTASSSVPAVANTLVLRDANANSFTNNTFYNTNVYVYSTSTPLTVQLTAASQAVWSISGTLYPNPAPNLTPPTFQLPNATTLPAGATYTFHNTNTLPANYGYFYVRTYTGTTVGGGQTGPGASQVYVLTDNTTTTGVWQERGFIPNNGSWDDFGLVAGGNIGALGSGTFNTGLRGNQVQVGSVGTVTTAQTVATTGYVDPPNPLVLQANEGYRSSSITVKGLGGFPTTGGNADIDLVPFNAGRTNITNPTINGGMILNGSTSGAVSITPPATAGTQAYTLPTALPGVSGYVLSATTAGVMSWIANTTSTFGNITIGVDSAQTISTTSGSLILQTAAGVNSGTITINAGAGADMVLSPNPLGEVYLDADVYVGRSNTNVQISSNGNADLYLVTGNIAGGGQVRLYNGANADVEIRPDGTGNVLLTADTTVVGDAAATATITTNGAGDLVLNTNAGSSSGSITIPAGANTDISIQANGTGSVLIEQVAIANDTVNNYAIIGSAQDLRLQGFQTTDPAVLLIGHGEFVFGDGSNTSIIIDATNSTISNNTGNITIQPTGAGDVYLSADTVRVGDVNTAATVTTNGTGDLTLSTNSGTNSGTIAIANGVNGNITIEPNGTGDVFLNTDIVRIGDANAAATLTTNGTGNLTLSTNTGTNSGTILINQGANANIEITPNGTGDVLLNADTIQIGDSGAAATLTTIGAGNLTLSTNTGTNSGTVVIANGVNGNITLTPNGTGDVILSADTVQVGDLDTAATLTTNGAGNLTISTNNGTNSTTLAIANGVNGNVTVTPNGTGVFNVAGGASIATRTNSNGGSIIGRAQTTTTGTYLYPSTVAQKVRTDILTAAMTNEPAVFGFQVRDSAAVTTNFGRLACTYQGSATNPFFRFSASADGFTTEVVSVVFGGGQANWGSSGTYTHTTTGTTDLILSTNNGTNSGTVTINDGVNGNIALAPNGTGRVAITNPLRLASYTAAALTALTGAVGDVAAVTNSPTVAGRLAFWDTTNTRWSYVSDNAAV